MTEDNTQVTELTNKLAMAVNDLEDQKALAQLFERRYNEELQRGMRTELANVKAEARADRLEAEVAALRQAASAPTTQEIPAP